MHPPTFRINAETTATHKGCTCGQCELGGWLSPRMLYQLQTQAHRVTDAMSNATQLERIDLLPYSNFIPPSIYAGHLHRAFYRGFISVFHTARELLLSLPTPTINAAILKAHAPRNSETAYFFSTGGKAEHVLDAIIYNAEARGEEDEYYRQLPSCRHDQYFETVRTKMGLSWGPYYHVKCDGEDWEAGNDVVTGRNDVDVKASGVPYKPPAWDLGEVIDWGEGMNASEIEASDRALHELNAFLEQVLPGIC